VARQLGIPEGASVISRLQKRYIDDQPWSVQTSLYPMALLEKGARRLLEAGYIDEGTIKYVTTALGSKQVGYQDVILVRSPDQDESTFFRLPDDGRIPVTVLLRTGYAGSPDGPGPFRLTKTVFPADRNQFVINAGQVPDRLAEAVQP
jgi:GntR family transcriptional regulator